MKAAVLHGLGEPVLRRCLDSLRATAPAGALEVHVVAERGQREQTLNAALDELGTADDLLLIGDDIVFTPGWYEALAARHAQAELLGLCTLYPGTSKVQDRGYDLVCLDGRVTLEPRDRGAQRAALAPFGLRLCDSVCGCLMWVRAPVFERVPRFREEGMNRWGEFIFTQEARRAGLRVAVVDHYVEHAGTGTKSNPDPKLRSTSHQVERDLWQQIVERHVAAEDVRLTRRSRLDPAFQAALEAPGQRILFYGIGTVTELLLSRARLASTRVGFCSGLSEEAGTQFHGQPVAGVGSVHFEAWDWVVLTPLHRGERIAREVLAPLLSPDLGARISAVEKHTHDGEEIYAARDLTPPFEREAGERGRA